MNDSKITELVTEAYDALHIPQSAIQRYGAITRNANGTYVSTEDGLDMKSSYYCNTWPSVGHYYDSMAVQVRWQEGANNKGEIVPPDFTRCVLNECTFRQLKEDAVIHFYERCSIMGCQFYPTQTIVIHNDALISNCSPVKVEFSDSDTPDITMNGTRHHKIYVDGGYFTLPQTSANDVNYGSDVELLITGCEVTISKSLLFPKFNFRSCNIQVDSNALMVRNCTDSTIHFNTDEEEAFFGMSVGNYSNNEIRIGTFDEDKFNTRVVKARCEIALGNSVNAMYNSGPVVLEKGTECKIFANNTGV